ncbi:hypothetical protein BH10CHL1_BH10CHL1_26270 [soil metagenome]
MSLRQRLSLDGTWLFQLDPADHTKPEHVISSQTWREAQVPLPWQAQFDDLRLASGTAWYRRSFSLDQTPVGAAVLHFGAVDYYATVWLNGQFIGEHEGGYLPFEFAVETQLHQGENELIVRVVDANDDERRFADFPFGEVPHGKQSWYGPIGGIWQSVWLELRPSVHLQSLRLTPDVATGHLGMNASLQGALPDNTQIQAQVIGPDGQEVAHTTLDASGQGQAQLDPAAIALWSPDSPALYTVTTRLVADSQTVDELSATCGFRTVEQHAGRIYLNGQPIYLRGVLDQAYYPKTIYTPPSLEFLEDQVHKAKALGLNCLRCHIKIEDPRYYEVADRLGILIWTEIPNWARLTPEASARVKATFRAMVERDWNHPSILIWSLVNEDWGTDLIRNPEHRQWLADFYQEARQIDPTRLIVDNSACRVNFHVAGDIEDYHEYRAIPDHAKQWDVWVADFASRTDWVWATDYAENRRPDLPLLVSEFGNWGLPDPDKIKEDGKEPWWFETGHEWGDGIVYPHAMRDRFAFWQLGDIFGSFEDFVQSSQEHMAHSLAYEIASMRLHPSIAGYVITEFTDVHWECNGLLTMQRDVKYGLDAIFTPLNQDNVVVARPQRWSGQPGASVPVAVRAFGIDGPGQQGKIQWQAGEAKGEVGANGGVVDVPLLAEGIVPLQVRWLADNGNVLANSQIALAAVKPPVPQQKLLVLNDTALATVLGQLGYSVVTDATAVEALQDAIVVAHYYTQDLQDAIQSGARLLLLADTDFNLAETRARLPVGSVVARSGTIWQGDWATSFSWLKKQGPFAHLPGGPLLEMEYAEIMPDAVITGVPAWIAREHNWAGLALGWIHKPVSLLTKVSYGRGTMVLTTFKLSAETLVDNVVAQGLFAGLVALA